MSKENEQVKVEDVVDNEEEWQELGNTPAHDFEKQPVLIGTLKDVSQSMHDPNINDYFVVNPEGVEVKVWGNVVLHSQLKRVEMGKKVRIEYLGMQSNQTGKKEYKNYKASVAK